jgi:hypothetical protein
MAKQEAKAGAELDADGLVVQKYKSIVLPRAGTRTSSSSTRRSRA